MRSPRAAAGLTVLVCLGVGMGLRLTMPPDVALLGLLIGITYSVLAAAVALTYRIGGVVNLALAMSALLGVVVHRTVLAFGLPWYAGIVTGLAVALAVGALTELVVVRRLGDAPRTVVMMTTAALAVALLPITDRVNSLRPGLHRTPDVPPGVPQLRVGDYIVSPSTVLMLLALPLLVGTITVVLARTQLGVRIQASAADRTLARLGGVPAGRYVLTAWAVAAMLATLVLATGPFSSDVSGIDARSRVLGVSGSLAPVFRQLVWPVAVAAIGRCRDIPAMVVAGIGVASLEQALIWNDARLGWLGVAVVVSLVLATVLQPPVGIRLERPGSWMAFRVGSQWPAAVRDLWWAVALRRGLPVLAVALFVAVAAGGSPDRAGNLASWAGVTVVAMAVFVETGLAGSLTFVHLPVAAAGAAVYIVLMSTTGLPALALLAAVIVGLVVGCTVALMDLRAGGVLTLALTLVLTLTANRWYADFSRTYPEPGIPVVGGTPLGDRLMLTVVSVLALAALVVVRNLVRSHLGWALIAQRDNTLAVEAFGYAAARLRLTAGGIAGALSGLGGCLIVANQVDNTPQFFSASIAVALIFACILGGLASPGGILLGTVCVFAVPMLMPRAGLDLGVGLAGLTLVLLAPTGLLGLYERARDWCLLETHRRLADRTSGADHAQAEAATASAIPGSQAPGSRGALSRAPRALGSPSPVVLEAVGLRKRFGGLDALHDVDLVVRQGEIVTLIGANGAGKTTTFDILSGFLEPDGGTVRLFGEDVTSVCPVGRSRRGLVRTFQDAALFPTLRLEQVLELAVGQRPGLPVLSGLLGLDPGRRQRQARVGSVLHRFGLEAFAETRVGELSTGTRRIAELAAASLIGARVLLLDEPSAGIAQREVEALAAALLRFRDEDGVSLLVIEHDIPLCGQISDRTVALGGGRVLATGPCEDVIANPAVITSYLGTDPFAVHRSGSLTEVGGPE